MANNLTLTSAAFDTSGKKFGSAALSGGYGVSPNNLIPATYPFTLECWAKGTSAQIPNAIRVIMGADKFGFVGCDSSNRIIAQYGNGTGTPTTLNSTVSPFDGGWHHIAFVLDASGGRLYVDGAQAASSTNTYAKDSLYANRNIGVGNHANLTNFQWPGEIDEAAIWSAGRFSSGFTVPSSAYTGAENGLLALWHLDSNGNDSVTAAATTYTLTGPSSGSVGTPSANFTAQVSGTNGSAVTVTPSDGGGGTFSPATVPLAAGTNTSATFTYTAGSAGAKTISTTNSGSLTNPPPVTYTASAATTSIAPDNAGIVYSPGTWLVGAAAAKTINAGAYFRTIFTGGSCTLNFDVSANNTPLPQLYYRVDGVSWTQATLAVSIALAMPSSTTAWPHHYLEVVIKSTSAWLDFGASQGGSRWSPQNAAVTLTSITLASGQSVSAPASLGQSVWFFGDSTTEGYRTVNGNGSGTQDTDGSDAMLGWAFQQRNLLGAEVAVIGFGGAAINGGGQLGVPSLPNSYNLLWSGQPRSFTAAPDLIVIAYGENDGSSVGDSTFISNYSTVINGLLSATPSTTKLACLTPFSQKKAADIGSAVTQIGNPRVSKIDTTGMFSAADSLDGQHPLGVANVTAIGPAVANKLRPLLQGIRDRWSHSTPPAGVAPGQVSSLTPGAPGVTTLPVSYTAPGAGTAPITYRGQTSPHGAGVWTDNAGSFTATGGTFIGLMGGTNYDLRIIASNAFGSSMTDYLVGDTTATSSWSNGLTATRYDVVLDGSSGAPGSARTATAYPNGNWPASGTITLTPNGGNGGAVTISVPAGSAAPASGSYTPSSAGEVTLTPTNSMGLANPWPAPFTCLAAAAGTAQTLSLTAGFNDPNGGRVLHRREYQKDAPSGTPNGFNGATFTKGWGEYWLNVASIGGATPGLFVRMFDAKSSGATTTAGTGTTIQDTVQVYGPVSTAGIKRILLPASKYLVYLDVATDSAFTNPVRIPYAFYIRNVAVVLTRSQEANLLCSWSHGEPPGTGFVNYTNGSVIASYDIGSDTSTSEAAFATAWAPVDGTTDITIHGGRANSVTMMELGRLFEAQNGDGLGLAGVYYMDGGYGATVAAMLATDGTPCPGLRQAAVNHTGGKFRYFRFTDDDGGGGPISYGTAGMKTALQGLVSYFAAHYPACAVMSLAFYSGLGSSAEANGCATIGSMVRNQMETADPRVVSGNHNFDWFGYGGYDHGHPSWASEGRIARGVWRSWVAAETPTFGGLGRSPADRFTQLAGAGTMVAGSGVVEVPINLAAGATSVSAVRWVMSGGDSDPIDPPAYNALNPNQFQGWMYLFPGTHRPNDGSPYIVFTGGAIDNANHKLRLFLDTSAGAGNVKYSDGTSGPEPATMSFYFCCNHGLGNFADFELPVLFDNRTGGVDGIPYGWPVPPRTDIVIARV